MWTLHPIEFADLPDWASDDHIAALNAFALQTRKPSNETYRQGALGIAPWCLDELAEKANCDQARQAPRAFFEENFTAFSLSNSDGQAGQVTAFYEPEVEAQLERGGPFQFPILRRPSDLVALSDDNRPAELDESYRFGRILGDGSVGAYFDRAQINAGALDGTTMAIAFVKDPIEAFFIHIQGAARLKLQNGTVIRITYDGKSGHPFTPIGKLLVQRGEIDADNISMQTIKAWLRSNSHRAKPLMEENKSYIFFKISEDADQALGPVAAAKVPLTAGRSLAVDRLVHTFGTPIFVHGDDVNEKSFARLMIAQETGTAIVGPARGDIFFGSGEKAGEIAGAVNSRCDFTVLIPRTAELEPGRVSSL